MIVNSPDDSPKNIYALPFYIEVLNYFTWQSWANFADEDELPQLKKYIYQTLHETKEQAIEGTQLYVTAFELSHEQPGKSSALLIRHADNYFLYLGDTDGDELEKSEQMRKLWLAVTPLVTQKKLKGMAIEVSFPSSQPEKSLFGYLTSKLFYKNLEILENMTGKSSLYNLPILVTHIKPKEHQEKTIQKNPKKESNNRCSTYFSKTKKCPKVLIIYF